MKKAVRKKNNKRVIITKNTKSPSVARLRESLTTSYQYATA